MLNHLAEARKGKKVTLNQIASLLGVRYQTVSDKINGVTKFDFDEALKIHQTFFPELDFVYLFTSEDRELKQLQEV